MLCCWGDMWIVRVYLYFTEYNANYHMSSFSETAAISMLRHRPIDLVEYPFVFMLSTIYFHFFFTLFCLRDFFVSNFNDFYNTFCMVWKQKKKKLRSTHTFFHLQNVLNKWKLEYFF